MGKNRNKNKHRVSGGKRILPISKMSELNYELSAEVYDERNLAKINKNLGFGYFEVILVQTGFKKRAYCRYKFSRGSPDYAIVEGKGKDDSQMVIPVSNACGNSYVSIKNYTRVVDRAEGREEMSSEVIFIDSDPEEEISNFRRKTAENKSKRLEREKRLLEEEEVESMESTLMVLIPKLEKQLDTIDTKSHQFNDAKAIIDKLKEGCTRKEAKVYHSNFQKLISST